MPYSYTYSIGADKDGQIHAGNLLVAGVNYTCPYFLEGVGYALVSTDDPDHSVQAPAPAPAPAAKPDNKKADKSAAFKE